MKKETILEVVSKNTGLNLKKNTRKRPYAEGRYIYFHLAREYASDGKSLARIGKSVKKDHATVLHGIRFCDDQLKVSKDFKVFYNDIKDEVLKKKRMIKRFPKSEKALDRIQYLEDQTRLLLDLQKDYKKEIARLDRRIAQLKLGNR